MLVLTRKPHESVMVGPEIRVTVLESRPEGVRLGIHAPRHVPVLRQELFAEVRERNREATRLDPAALAILEAAPRPAQAAAPRSAVMACLPVKDLDRSVSFYGLLGFRPQQEASPFPGSAVLRLEGQPLCLVPEESPAPGRLVLTLRGVQDLSARLSAAGCEVAPAGAGLAFQDPDGHRLVVSPGQGL